MLCMPSIRKRDFCNGSPVVHRSENIVPFFLLDVLFQDDTHSSWIDSYLRRQKKTLNEY